MRRVFPRISACVALLTLAATASASPIPFQIGGSELNILALGVGDYSYDDNSGISALLDEGEGFNVNFGYVDVGAFVGALGLAELTVHLLAPTTSDSVSDLAAFAIGAIFDFGKATVAWGDPVTIGYSYGGLSGGVLSLDMFDLEDVRYQGGISLWGRITNVQSPGTAPVSVPEPGVLLLLGSGLLATAGMRRRTKTRT